MRRTRSEKTSAPPPGIESIPASRNFSSVSRTLIFARLARNPISTMVTFELLVAPSLDILSGAQPRPLALLGARMARTTEHNPALAHFLPATLSWDNEEPIVEEIPWQGSGDLVALTQANCFLYVPQGGPRLTAGEWARVVLRRGAL